MFFKVGVVGVFVLVVVVFYGCCCFVCYSSNRDRN